MAGTADQLLSGFIGWIGHRAAPATLAKRKEREQNAPTIFLSARILCPDVPTASKGMLVGNAERESTSRFAPLL